jgi:hypothetical protein
MRYTGPAAEALHEGLRQLEHNRNDREVRRQMGRLDPVVRDAKTGEPTACYVYRLNCGHLIQVWLQLLPESTRYTYCAECDPPRERFVVEHMTD